MTKFEITLTARTDDLAFDVANELSQDEVLNFILQVDAEVGSLQFTKQLSAALIDIIKQEEE